MVEDAELQPDAEDDEFGEPARKGATCSGRLAPTGSGTATSPVSVGAYGSGARPKLVGNDVRATVYLRNVQGWEICGLDVSDPGKNVTDPRTGIYVELTDFGVGSHFAFDDNYVHDVAGCDCTNPGQPGGGIVFNATGSEKVTSFSGVTVTDNVLRRVSGIGIGTSSLWARRSIHPTGPGTAYGPDTGILVQGNRLSELGGDGINITNGQHALIQHNTVQGFGLQAIIDHAGIWAWNSDCTTIQHNTIGGGDAGKFGAFAFDVDGASVGTLYQYNFNHGNSGLMLVCSVEGLAADRPTIRYNISQNDRDVSGGVVILACTKQTNISVYGNTVYAPLPLQTRSGGTSARTPRWSRTTSSSASRAVQPSRTPSAPSTAISTRTSPRCRPMRRRWWVIRPSCGWGAVPACVTPTGTG